MSEEEVYLKVKTFNGEVVELKAKVGDNLGEILSKHNLIALPCNGRGLCGQCLIRVKGKVSNPTGNEVIRGYTRDLRLACQTRLLGNVFVEVLQRMYYPYTSKLSMNVIVHRISPIFDVIRVTESKPIDEGGSYIVINAFKQVNLAQCKYLVKIREFIVGCLNREVSKPRVLLVDLGTTKIAYNVIEDNKVLKEDVILNPLIKYGLDIITRLSRIIENNKVALEMQKELIYTLKGLVQDDSIVVIGVAGNSVMESILLGLPVKQLAVKPFQPFMKGPFIYVVEGVPLYIAPMLGGFVGGDAFANLALAEYMKLNKPYMIVDLGTNTEVILALEDKYIATSTPAGPAFEGHITRGVGIQYVGVEKVKMIGFKGNGEPLFEYTVVGEGKPAGLLGSGIISLVAELLRNNLIDRSGRIIKGYKYISGVKAITIVNAEETSTGEPIIFTQKDVREFQKAMSAIRTAWKILMMRAGINIDELKHILVIGNFGSSLDTRDMLDLELIPRVDNSKIVILGNGVIAGLKTIIMDSKHEEYMYKLIKNVRIIELAEDPEFNRLWINNLSFPHIDK